MAINLKAKETLIQAGEMKGQYRFILGTELYNKLSESKVIKEAAIRSGVSVGVMQVCWDAAGEVIKAWCTEGHSVAVPAIGNHAIRRKSQECAYRRRSGYHIRLPTAVLSSPQALTSSASWTKPPSRLPVTTATAKWWQNVTSDDKGDVEDPDNTPGGGGSDNTPGGGNTEGGGAPPAVMRATRFVSKKEPLMRGNQHQGLLS